MPHGTVHINIKLFVVDLVSDHIKYVKRKKRKKNIRRTWCRLVTTRVLKKMVVVNEDAGDDGKRIALILR